MTYDEAKMLMIDYLNGQLNNEKAAMMDAFINENPEFRKEFGNMKNLWANMEQIETPEPSDKMRENFNAMLQGYQQGLEAKNDSALQRIWQQLGDWWSQSYVPQAVMGIALLLLGIQIGYNLQNQNGEQKMVGLTNEVQEMKQMMMLTLIEQQSVTQRLKAVNLTYELNNDNDKVATVLLNTLNNDENINVRLAAAEALLSLADQPKVRTGLIRSISQQDSPIVQSALVDVLVVLQEKNVTPTLQELLKKDDLNPEIREKINTSLSTLL